MPPETGTPPPETPPEPPKPTACAPEGGGPHRLLEGETLTVTLGCSTGLSTPELRFTVSPLPAGASMDEVSGTLRWKPGKDQAAVWVLTITERTTGETGILQVGVMDN